MNEPQKRDGFRTLLFISGAALALFSIAAAITLALNWGSAQALFQSAAGTLTDLHAVQTAIQKEHDTPQVKAMSKWHNRVPGPILSLQLINPPFAEGLNEDDLKAKALEVALTAREALRSPDGYDNYEVIITRQQGAGIKFTSSHRYAFRASELPPR